MQTKTIFGLFYKNRLIRESRIIVLKLSNDQINFSTSKKGSYAVVLQNARNREKRLVRDKYTSGDYRKYQKNGGFGPGFLPFEAETKQEKLEKKRQREEYARQVKERNSSLASSNMSNTRFSNNSLSSDAHSGGQARNGNGKQVGGLHSYSRYSDSKLSTAVTGNPNGKRS